MKNLNYARLVSCAPEPRRYGKPGHLDRARELRRNSTTCEQIVWRVLRGLRKSHGLHFRRQAPIGPYTADFCCHSLRVVIEADGVEHVAEHDAKRDRWFARAGYRTIRIRNETIMNPRADLAEFLVGALRLEAAGPEVTETMVRS